LATIIDSFGVHEPQKILFSEIVTERKPGPGRTGVGGITGVAVYSPIKIGMGANVEVGTFGSQVGIRTMVGDGVIEGVMEGVHVGNGVNVINSVEVGSGVFVGRLKISFIEHACNKTAIIATRYNLRISLLINAIIL